MSDGQGPRTREDVGHLNRRAVLRQLVLHGPQSRNDIAAGVNLTAATLSRISRSLIDAGLIAEIPARRDSAAGPGRPSTQLDIAPEGGQVLGVTIAPSLQAVALHDLKNRTIAVRRMDIASLYDADSVIREVADNSRRLIASCLPDRRRLLGGFVMLPGTVDRAHGRVHHSSLLGWREISLGDRLSDSLGLPVRVESIATAGALAEYRFGAARGRHSLLVLMCGLGLAAGLIVNDEVVIGHGLGAGGIGTMPLTGSETGARRFDRVAGGFGILDRLRNGSDPAAMSSQEQIDLLEDAIARDRNRDEAVSLLMENAGHALGRVAAQFVYLVMPEIVVLRGPLAGAPSYVAAAQAALADAVSEGMGYCPTEITTSDTMTDSFEATACGLAICEYLFERTLDLSALGGPS